MPQMSEICVLTLTLLQGLNCLQAVETSETLNGNLTQLKDELWTKNEEEHKLANAEQMTAIGKEVDSATELEANRVNVPSEFSLKATNRSARQLYYSPNFFFIQNYGAEDSKCMTSRGLAGVCMDFNSCIQAHTYKHQIAAFRGTQTWPAEQNLLPYFRQQPEFCILRHQFGRASYGMCCLDSQGVTSGNTPQQQEMPQEPGVPIPANNEDSEVLEADLNSFQPEPPTYDNTANTIDYDPIENFKQVTLANRKNNYMRYPWPQQFVGFSGIQQWPPPLPTHPPSIASWPPPVPTHPPNHHYPTHPPLNEVGGVSHIQPATTTRRPTYPQYPTQRTTTTTTTRRSTTASSSAVGLPLQCGLKNAENPDQERIVGGTNASPHEFPWIAVLFKSGKQFCGGSLITNSHILTAAHCVARMTSWDVAALTAHLGDYNIRTDFEVKHVSRRIKRLVRHKGFDFNTLHNDIAILTLNEPVQFTKEVQPVCLPTSNVQQSRSYSGQIAIVAGWGSLRENGPQPSILQKVQIPIWTNSECAHKYGRAAPAGIISSMICAGQAAKDSCSGDSGGPLIVNDGSRYIQVGIVSWGIGCGQGQYPGVYTRVTSLLPWIYKNIK